MNERGLRNQESSFPGIQEIHIAPQTTFKKLGIEDLREKRLSLDNEPVTIISIWDSQQKSINYFAFYDHPLVGAHLAHFLNAEAAFKVDPGVAKGVILGDFNMPRSAGLNYEIDVKIHKLHEGDPQIRLHYEEFVEQGLEQQTNALENSKYDNLFNQAMQLNIINLQAVEPAFFDLLAILKSERILGNTRGEIYRSLHRAPIERRYSQFLRLKHEYNVDTPSFDYQVMHVIPRFLEPLDNEGQKQLFIARATLSPYSTVIDFSTKEIFGERYDGVELSFSNDSVEVIDHNGNSIQIEFQEDTQALYFPYRVVSYKFAEEPLQDALYAVIAWNKTSDGQRRFLSQNQLMQFFPHLNFNRSKRPDVYLGRNLLGYFSKDVTDKWPIGIALEGHPRPQKMMGAQMSVRDSLDSDKYPHARQLLAGSVVRKLEEHALTS